ncbi:MAG: beta-N-acetylhexosaminidase [Propionibacteriales bacterium]|nr:beta-N-acetylhexosaminidase [Propionibacteriales bacterium]
MSLEEKAGQVIVARYTGTSAPVDLVSTYHLGGVIVMSENVTTVEAVRRSNQALQAADDREWPLFIGVDQEGGLVDRLESPITPFPSLMTYGAAGRRDLAREAARASGTELRAAGFTVVFAPDADVTIGPGDPTIGSRSAGSDPDRVSAVVTAAVRGYRESGIAPVVKHFPGHGSVTTDSHLGLPVQGASLPQLRRRDLEPFAAAIETRAPAAMIGHLAVRTLDDDTPATLSRPVVTGLLRDRLGFDGLTITDSMEMGAIIEGYGTGAAAVRALQAGNDVVLMPADTAAAHGAIVDAVQDGRLSERRLDEAAARVVALMLHGGARDDTPRPGTIGSHGPVSYRASKAAVTVVEGPCSGRLVGKSVVVSGDPAVVPRFKASAAAAGLSTSGGTSVVLLGYGAKRAEGDVVVTTDAPYALGDSDAPVKIATYGDTPGAMRALVDVLIGKARAPGRLPVPVDGVSRRGC